jgi:hypothetical protein
MVSHLENAQQQQKTKKQKKRVKTARIFQVCNRRSALLLRRVMRPNRSGISMNIEGSPHI